MFIQHILSKQEFLSFINLKKGQLTYLKIDMMVTETN